MLMLEEQQLESDVWTPGRCTGNSMSHWAGSMKIPDPYFIMYDLRFTSPCAPGRPKALQEVHSSPK